MSFSDEEFLAAQQAAAAFEYEQARQLGISPPIAIDIEIGDPRPEAWDRQEQPAPKPNDGPSCHDLVIKDILSRPVQWDVSVGRARYIRDQVAADLLARKEHGIAVYRTILQPGNGRDFLLDLYEELMDATCYARGRLLEVSEDSLEWEILFEIYDDLAGHLVRVRRLRNAASGTD